MNEVVKNIANLVAHFQDNLDAYRNPAYNETQLRIEFIDPFFEALGWDVANKAGYAEQYKDVIHEDAIKVSGATKAPDYCFRIGGVRKFFLETKKPSIDIKDQVGPAYQLRRYAWSAKLPLSILTNFAELAIYDCRIRPKPADKASIGRARSYPYTEYIKSFDEINNFLSKESVLKGSFDRFAETDRQKRGTTEVDSEFLKEIENWREILAKDIARRNLKLSVRELNYAVQLIIDRIIFLRMCEDRGIESYGQIQSLLNGTNAYHRLREFFYHADGKYNSGLFDFKADRLTPELNIDDHPLKEIFKNLYYPDSPYEFSVLGADILGHVYEQFLGKVIRLTGGHQAKVEEKPEVRKAGGVYYTPTYIVNYIVMNTVGKLCQAKSPKQISSLRILDPACGSGSFLLGAYQYLLDYHRDWYQKKGTAKYRKEIYQGRGGQWYLSIQEKKNILLNNIFGVDIDPQAVEVTKLSLLLKVLEGENQDTLERQMKLFKERALPDLESNIKCGNSLISHDIENGQQLGFFGNEKRQDLNPFEWDRDGFPLILGSGGFDAVIGNPPYLFITELDEMEKDYFAAKYSSCEYRFDVYGLFIELSLMKLLRQGGFVSFIIPHTLLSNDSFQKLRRMLLKNSFLEEVIDIGPGVFQNAKNETMIFIAKKILNKRGNSKRCKVVNTRSATFPIPTKEFFITQSDWLKNSKAEWLVRNSPAEVQLLNKIDKIEIRLGDLCTINQGLRTGNNEKYLSIEKKNPLWKPVVGGKEVGRYEPLPHGLFVYYDPNVLDAPRRREIFETTEKIIVQEIRNITLPRRIIATYDRDQFYCLQSTNVINLKAQNVEKYPLKYLLGILNSSSINYFFRQRFSGNNHIASNQLAQIPIVLGNDKIKAQVLNLVERILGLQRRKTQARTANEETIIDREIAAVDSQIDHIVYELYGLIQKEIEIITTNN